VIEKESESGKYSISYRTKYQQPAIKYQLLAKNKKNHFTGLMKKIQLHCITFADKSSHYSRDHQHSISLGNGRNVYFSNINQARAFLHQTNRFLNDTLFELNQLYTEVFAQYRLAWFYLGRPQQTISENLMTVEKKFDHLVRLSYSANYNFYAFLDLKMICQCLAAALLEMESLYRKRKFYVQLANLSITTRRIEQTCQLVMLYPGENKKPGDALIPPGA